MSGEGKKKKKSFQAVWWMLRRKEEDGHSFLCPLHEVLLGKAAEHWALFLCSSAGLLLLSWDASCVLPCVLWAPFLESFQLLNLPG